MATTLMRLSTKKNQALIETLLEETIKQHNMAKNALVNNDVDLALKTLEGDKKIDLLYANIRSEIEFTITKRPLAKELRRTLAYLSIAKDIERLADYAKHISKFIIKTMIISPSSLRRIRKVHKPFREMLPKLLKTLKNESIEGTIDLTVMDKTIYSIRNKIFEEVVSSLSTKGDKQKINERIFVLNICNSLERASNHILNICEEIIFIKTGTHHLV